MRYSRSFIPTLKHAPADAETPSHHLLLRAGLIRPLARGLYDVLPLGLRVQRKIERIVRDELNRAGALEVLLPVVQPAELWRESQRWDTYRDEGLLATLCDRSGREFCLGPTHEEVVTDLVRRDVRSYRDVPLVLYQIQTKFRDEIRPRFGLLRTREFTMMDAYSFDRSPEAAQAAYQQMYDAYVRIFSRCGLTCRPVEASSGAMGGKLSHEFQVLAATGENAIASCEHCGYAANVEKAAIGERTPLQSPPAPDQASAAPIEAVATPGMHTIEEVTAFLQVPARSLIKTLIYETDDRPLAVLVRGDHSVNDEKLAAAVGAAWARLADAERVQHLTGAPVGFAGPVGLHDVEVVADTALREPVAFVSGANTADTHYRHVRLERDAHVDRWADVRNAETGDACPRCPTGTLLITRGIEVGHVFFLGDRYSRPMHATILDETGQEVPLQMGCYGIGIGRTLAAAVEQHHDADGIRWPLPIAPFQVEVLSLSQADAAVVEAAERLYHALLEAGVEVLYDDRDERAGVKRNDADLIGIPFQVVVGGRGLRSGQVELKRRHDGTIEHLAVAEAPALIAQRVQADLARPAA